MEKAEYRKRVLLKLLTHPSSLLPLVVGLTSVIAGWAAGARAGGLLLFAGIAGLLLGAGTFLTRMFVKGSAFDEVLRQMQRENEKGREQELDSLEENLEQDGDARTEAALRDLRALQKLMRDKPEWVNALDASSSLDILTGADELFGTCIRYLQISLQLWQVADAMETDAVRGPILEQREELIQEVGDTTRHISSILARAQALTVGETSDSGIRRLREELDASLEVAKNVRERIAEWGASDYALEP